MRRWRLDYRGAPRGQARRHHAEHVPDGADRPVGVLRRLRQPRRRDLRLLEPRRLAGSSARRPVQRLHRLRLAALRRRRDPRGARVSPAHRRRAVHRSLAGRGVAALPRPCAARLRRQRRVPAARRQPRPRAACRTVSIPPPGDDRWVAIAVDGDAAFAALCDVMERPELASDVRFADGRPAAATNATGSTREIAAWTRDASRDGDRAAAAGARRPGERGARTAPALCADPQLLHRGHLLQVPHADLGHDDDRGLALPALAHAGAHSGRRRRPTVATRRACWATYSATTTPASPSWSRAALSSEGRRRTSSTSLIDGGDDELLVALAQHGA